MRKRILSCLLCVVLLVPICLVSVHAEEITYRQVLIDAGEGVQAEKAIIENDEIYIAATSFSKYTRFQYDEAKQIFLVKGQEEGKAFKKVTINPETKKAAVGTKVIELNGSFVEDGVTYLPLCQMLPILNADIVTVESGIIYIVNNRITLAELLYDFDINDYYFNLSEEFLGNDWTAAWFVGFNYMFDSVIRTRFNRLDVVFNSGTIEDYKIILEEYLKDDELFHEARNEYDAAGDLLSLLTDLGGIGQHFYNTYDWLEKVAEMEVSTDMKKYLKPYDLEVLLKKGYTGNVFDDELGQLLTAFYDSELVDNDIYQDATAGGISFIEGLEVIDYIYAVLNQVDDHRKMIDAVYNITIPGTAANMLYSDSERLAAAKVYDLYSGNFVPNFVQRMVQETMDSVIEGTKYANINVYSLTVNLAGEILELFMPGDSGDRGRLHLHSNVVNSAARKCAAPTLDTEESTNEYRLSLLLTMIASRKCYQVMDETKSSLYYEERIEKIENMIKGLYLVAENVAFDTYENYEKFAESNRETIKKSGIVSEILSASATPIVTTYYEKSCECDGTGYSYSIPQINLDSPEIDAINQEILTHWYDGDSILDIIHKCGEENDFTIWSVDYEYSVVGDILSLAMCVEETFNDGIWWEVYTISVSEKREVTKETVLDAYGMSLDEYAQTVKDALSVAFLELWERYSDGDVESWKPYLEGMLEERNLSKAKPFFNADGKLCILGDVGIAAGAGFTQQIIELEGFEITKEQRNQLQQLLEYEEKPQNTENFDVAAKSEGVMTYEEYAAAALGSEVVIEAYVQDTQGWWFDNDAGYGKITVYAQEPAGGYFIYEMKCDEADAGKVVSGAKIKVTGYKAEWCDGIEILDATFELGEGIWTAEAMDATSLLGTEDLIKHQNKLVFFSGLTVEGVEYRNGEWGDDIYVSLSKNGATYSFCVVRYLTGPDSEVYKTIGELRAGDVIDVTGYLRWDEGIYPHITGVTVK